jgi:hypothetical protein
MKFVITFHGTWRETRDGNCSIASPEKFLMYPFRERQAFVYSPTTTPNTDVHGQGPPWRANCDGANMEVGEAAVQSIKVTVLTHKNESVCFQNLAVDTHTF